MTFEEPKVRMKLVFFDTKDSTLTGIQCLECGLISFNANDLSEHYCAGCHKFGKLVPTTEIFNATT